MINIDNLISICTLRLKKNAAHKKALFIRSSSYLKKGKYAEAVEDAHNLLNLDSRNVGAYFILGSAHDKMAEIDDAIENFSIVLELDPTHVNALLARGACLNKKGEFKAGLEDYEAALKLDSEKLLMKKSKAEPRRLRRPIENEEDILKPSDNKLKLIEMDTSCIQQQQLQRTNSNGSLHKASSMRLGEESLAELSLSRADSSKKASSEQIKQAELLHSQGWEARKRQDFRLAIELYSKALEHNPLHFKAYFNRGFAYDKIG